MHTATTAPTERPTLPAATVADTARIVAEVVAPTLAKGVIIRRPGVVGLVERLDLDSRAIRRMQAVHARYGDGPLLLRLPGKTYAVVLAPEHVNRVLQDTPVPFSAAADEKRAALAHFEPEGVLISGGPDRADRRRFNEAVLEPDRAVHHLGERFVGVVRAEAARLLEPVRRGEVLTWDAFTAGWHRVVRRVAFGDAAGDDDALTDVLARLRGDGNWAFLRPQRKRLRARFLARLARHVARAEPGSLAAVMAGVPSSPRTAPEQQPVQWLFAYDAAGIASIRALAVLLTHPEVAARARDEAREQTRSGRLDLPFLRACVLESLRLWPTTPILLRQTTAATTWEGGSMPAGTGVLIYAPFFHRDERRLPEAHRFSPELWLRERTSEDWPLVPFSAGPARCPGQQLVLLTTSTLLAALIEEPGLRLLPPCRVEAGRRMPGTLNHAGLRFALAR